MRPRFSGQAARILDFDCECRPLAWYGGDFVTKQPTAIAWKFVGENTRTQVSYIGASGDTNQTLDEEYNMLTDFLLAYSQADIVTGHFIRGFDLPLLNGAMMRLGIGTLADKMSQDTKLDLAKKSGISVSQENLGAMFELRHPKVQMDTTKWAYANMLTRAGVEQTVKRVKGDVEQHVELRARMLSSGLLGPPKLWTARSQGTGKYHA